MGVLQGATEFLPVSSSGHLILLPWLLGWEDPGLTFDVALHVGTLVAVLAYFAPLWIRIFVAAFTGRPVVLSESEEQRGSSNMRTTDPKRERMLLWFLVAATIPGAIAGALLEKHAETTFRDPTLIAAMLILVGLIMWGAEKAASFAKRIPDIGWGEAMTI